jgi:hypothetical protein
MHTIATCHNDPAKGKILFTIIPAEQLFDYIYIEE